MSPWSWSSVLPSSQTLHGAPGEGSTEPGAPDPGMIDRRPLRRYRPTLDNGLEIWEHKFVVVTTERMTSFADPPMTVRCAVFFPRGRDAHAADLIRGMARDRVIRDPIYGYVRLPERLRRLVDSPIYQRLRRVSQTSLTTSVYPAATGSRFEHGLGAMALAGRAFTAAMNNSPETREDFLDAFATALGPSFAQLSHDARQEVLRLAVMGVALLHDVGHPPFSHVLEAVYKVHATTLFLDNDALAEDISRSPSMHERAGQWIVDRILAPLLDGDPILRDAIRSIYAADEKGRDAAGALHSIVAGELDVDRLDYLMRDGQKAGTEFGAIDWERLIDAFEVRRYEDGFRFAPDIRARSAVETLLLQRTQAYRWITFHHRVVASNVALAQAVRTLLELSREEANAIGVGDHMLTLGDLFGAVVPNLDYLDPGSTAFDRTARRIATVGAEPTTLAASDLFPGVGTNTSEYMAASVDDGTVVQGLLRGRLLADGVVSTPSGSPSNQQRQKLTAFIGYVDAALFRRKNVISVWRNEEDFARSAGKLYDDFQRVASKAFDDLRKQGLEVEEEHKALSAAMEASRHSKAILVNWIVDDVLALAEQRQRFEQQLQHTLPRVAEVEGEWRCELARFKPFAVDEAASILWHGDGHVPVERSSAIVRSLGDVEHQRTRLHIYFFLRSPAVVPIDSADALSWRSLAVGHVVEGLRRFATNEYPKVVGRSGREQTS